MLSHITSYRGFTNTTRNMFSQSDGLVSSSKVSLHAAYAHALQAVYVESVMPPLAQAAKWQLKHVAC